MELRKFIATTIREYLNENRFTTSYGVEYSSLEDWAYDYAKEHADGFNNYEEAKEYLDWFFKLIKTLPNPMFLYRILHSVVLVLTAACMKQIKTSYLILTIHHQYF
jgi:hypothetical protein